MKRLVLLLSMMLGTQYTSAHTIYVAERHGELGVVLGYATVDQAYNPKFIASVTGYSATGTAENVQTVEHEQYVSIKPDADTAIVDVAMDYGFYSKTQDGRWKRGKKSEVPGATQGLQALKYNVTILKPVTAIPTPRGKGLEIVPLENPLTKKRGDMLAIQVLLDGKPLPGVRLWEDFRNNDTLKTQVTDGNGKTTVTLRDDMLNVIALEYDAPVQGDPNVDFIRYAASLSFSLIHPES